MTELYLHVKHELVSKTRLCYAMWYRPLEFETVRTDLATKLLLHVKHGLVSKTRLCYAMWYRPLELETVRTEPSWVRIP